MDQTRPAREQSPTVSVVIPVFNRPVTVCRAIESVLAQSRQDFEIIVVDDASTDGTGAAVTAVGDPRITLIRHEQNRGGSAARNTGIAASSGEFVAFLDSDDEWLPTKLARQLEVFERSSNDRLALVYTASERVFPDGSVSRRRPRRAANLVRALLTENVIGESSLGMVRRSSLQAVGGFDDTLPSCQDLDLWLRICERFDVEVVPEALVRVANGNDGGRITNSVSAAIRGRDIYCRKHREKMIRHGVLHKFLRDSGWSQQRRGRNVQLARSLYAESLRANPFALFTYVLLLSTLVPQSWAERTARGKRLVARLLTLGPDASFAPDSYRLVSSAKLQRNTHNDSTGS